MPTITKEQLSPKNVLDVLSRHILVDGYHVVMDMERSQGSYLFDARSDRPILDFFSCFATLPIGYNHPKMADPEFRVQAARVFAPLRYLTPAQFDAEIRAGDTQFRQLWKELPWADK